MVRLISVLLARVINFLILESSKSLVRNKKYYQKKGFPYPYFEVEFLSEAEVQYRFHLIYIYLMVGISTSLPLPPSVVVILLLPSSRLSIERIQVTKSSS